jgi:hypothetical protein
MEVRKFVEIREMQAWAERRRKESNNDVINELTNSERARQPGDSTQRATGDTLPSSEEN